MYLWSSHWNACNWTAVPYRLHTCFYTSFSQKGKKNTSWSGRWYSREDVDDLLHAEILRMLKSVSERDVFGSIESRVPLIGDCKIKNIGVRRTSNYTSFLNFESNLRLRNVSKGINYFIYDMVWDKMN